MRAALLVVMAAVVSAAAIDSQTAATTPSAAVAAPRLVTIDVVAADARGRAVEDLKAPDFELHEDTTALPLESVRLVRPRPSDQANTIPASDRQPAAIRTAVDERQAASGDDARLFAIFLDDYHIADANTDRVRSSLLDFVDHDVTAGDLLVVVRPLDSLLAIRMTRDHAAARAAIESFTGRKGDYEPRNAYERDFIAGTPARIDSARNQVALSAINALAVHLGSLTDGRKTLIVASGNVGRADRRRGQEYLPTLDTIIRSANRSNVSVYPFDPRGGDDSGAPAADLHRLAEETDGEPIAADSDSGLRRVAS